MTNTQLLIMKFGGTSVGSPERFRQVAGLVSSSEGHCVAVLSAMSGVTNALIGGARAAAAGRQESIAQSKAELHAKHMDTVASLLKPGLDRDQVEKRIDQRLQGYERLCQSMSILGEMPMRGYDAIASIGEDLSTNILAALLREQGYAAQAVNATELVCTDAHHGAAVPDLTATRQWTQARLGPLLEQGITPVVTGFIGATPAGATTTLGRGGSDYSAAIMGVSLDADEVWIWTDVSGILSADPRLVPTARTLPELSYAEAEELAYFGADVLHPKTVAPLVDRGIDLRILNSYEPEDAGTRIVPTPNADRLALPAIISSEGLSLIVVAGNGSSWGLAMASRALRSLAEEGVDVFMYSQSFSERSLNLVVRDQDQHHCVRVLEHEFASELASGLLNQVDAQQEVAALSVVATCLTDGPSVASQAFAALGNLGVRVISVAQPASACSVSFIIAEQDIARAVPAMHRALGLDARVATAE